MDGRAKRVNGLSNQHSRNLVIAIKQDWADYVGLVEYSYNVNMPYSVTKWSSFVMVYFVDAFQPTT